MVKLNNFSISDTFIIVYTIVSIIINIIAIIYLPFVENLIQFAIWIAVIICVVISIPLLLFCLFTVVFIRCPYGNLTWEESSDAYVLQPPKTLRNNQSVVDLSCVWKIKSGMLKIWISQIELITDSFVKLEPIKPSLPLLARDIKKKTEDYKKISIYTLNLNREVSNYFSLTFLPKIQGKDKKKMTYPHSYRIETKIKYKLKSKHNLINQVFNFLPFRVVESQF